MSLISVLLLVGAVYGVALIFYLLKRNGQNYYLAGSILILVAYLGENILLAGELNSITSHIIFISLPLLFLIGPFLTIHLEHALLGGVRSKGTWIRYLLPLIILVYMIPFYILPSQEKIKYFEAFRAISANQEAFKINIIYFLFQVQVALYLFQTTRKIEKEYAGELKKLRFYLKSVGVLFTVLALLQLGFYSDFTMFSYFNYSMTLFLVLLILFSPLIRSQKLQEYSGKGNQG